MMRSFPASCISYQGNSHSLLGFPLLVHSGLSNRARLASVVRVSSKGYPLNARGAEVCAALWDSWAKSLVDADYNAGVGSFGLMRSPHLCSPNATTKNITRLIV